MSEQAFPQPSYPPSLLLLLLAPPSREPISSPSLSLLPPLLLPLLLSLVVVVLLLSQLVALLEPPVLAPLSSRAAPRSRSLPMPFSSEAILTYASFGGQRPRGSGWNSQRLRGKPSPSPLALTKASLSDLRLFRGEG